jgi:hypothetical protein
MSGKISMLGRGGVVVDSATIATKDVGRAGGGGHNSLTVSGRGGSFELSCSWVVPPQDCCWDFAFS